MAGSVPAGCFNVGDRAAGCPVRSPHVWTAPPLPVDEFPNYICNGPQPTQFCDSPMSYQLVKQGKLPPLEERLPVPKDVPIIQPLDGIDAIQNWVPHPSSPYHPGEDVAKLNVDFDQAKTREM